MKKLALTTAMLAALVLPVAALTAKPTVTLAAAPLTVTYGSPTMLSGKISTAQAGETVTIDNQDCGTTAFKRLATASTASTGAYAYSAKPVKNTSYRAKYKNATSTAVAVKVAPRLALRKLRLGRYVITVTAADSLVGKWVAFQRLRNGRWVTLKKPVLKTVKAGTAPTQISSVTLRIRMRAGLRLRAVMPPSQVGTCYVATKSKTIRS
jgi:hypothetical protein